MATFHKILEYHKLEMDVEPGTADSIAYENIPDSTKDKVIHQEKMHMKKESNFHREELLE